ncbi:hypothetical protein [Pseudogemmobacter sonorensis]
MTNRAALVLALAILVALAGDFLFTGGKGAVFLAGRFLDLIEWVAFWR